MADRGYRYLRVYEESFQRDNTHRIRINMFRPKKKKVVKEEINNPLDSSRRTSDVWRLESKIFEINPCKRSVDPCAEKLRRKIYRKIRFQTWYRKANYYHRKRNDLNKTIAQYRGVDVLSNKKRLYRLRRDMIRSLFRYGSYYNEYFLFGYEGKDAAYRDGFITEACA